MLHEIGVRKKFLKRVNVSDMATSKFQEMGKELKIEKHILTKIEKITRDYSHQYLCISIIPTPQKLIHSLVENQKILYNI
jgi:hypothetical protein